MNQSGIGNENFKIWLKRLDPVTRVERMSAIARTQASAGLRGSLIKASLAQLSQRCHVMLFKLTDKEIKHYTRRKPVKKITDDGTIRIEVHSRESEINNTFNHPRKTSKESSFNCTEEKNEGSSRSTAQTSSSATNLKQSEVVQSSAHYTQQTIKLKANADKKLQEKYLELFGEDTNDVSCLKNESSHVLNKNQTSSVGQINNFMSTTVNVNIYNTPTDSLKESKKRKGHFKNNLSSVETSNKRLKINVSLSNNNSDFDKSDKLDEANRTKNSNKIKGNKPRKKVSAKSGKSKEKYSHRKSSTSVASVLNVDSNSNEEDAVQELWNIFGMVSPTSRSESIIRSYPYAPQESGFSDNPSVSQTSTTESMVENSHHVGQQNSKSAISSNNKNGLVGVIEKNINFDGKLKSNSGNIEPETTISEPLCKITKTFSLAEPSREPSSSDKNTVTTYIQKDSIDYDTQGKTAVSSMRNSSSKENHASIRSSSSDIETIILSDDEDNSPETSTNKPQQNESLSNENKVGKIRVKSLGLLLDPSLSANTPTNLDVPKHSPSKVTSSSSHPKVSNSSVSTAGKSVEECFYTIYSYYCDELLESKVLKLGELLHLAISDDIRRKERIKRAEQLSSLDLVNQEKQRAIKEFNDMMKVRGNEFAPLFQTILNKFEQSSKLTLLIALFIRIFVHAQKIDSVNGENILPARDVVHAMLSKHNCADIDVLNVLKSDPNSFLNQVEMVKTLLQSYYKEKSVEFENTILASKPTSKTSTETSKSTSQSENSSNKVPESSLSSTRTCVPVSHNVTSPSNTLSQGSLTVMNSSETFQGRENIPFILSKNGPPNVTLVPRTISSTSFTGAPRPVYTPRTLLAHQYSSRDLCKPPSPYPGKEPTLTLPNKSTVAQPFSAVDKVNPAAPPPCLENYVKPAGSALNKCQLGSRPEMSSNLSQNAMSAQRPERESINGTAPQRTHSTVNRIGSQLNHMNMQKQHPNPYNRSFSAPSVTVPTKLATRPDLNVNYSVSQLPPPIVKLHSNSTLINSAIVPSVDKNKMPIPETVVRFPAASQNTKARADQLRPNYQEYAAYANRTGDSSFHSPPTYRCPQTQEANLHKTQPTSQTSFETKQTRVGSNNSGSLNALCSGAESRGNDVSKNVINNNPILAHHLLANQPGMVSLFDPNSTTLPSSGSTSYGPTESSTIEKTFNTNDTRPSVLQTTSESLQGHVPSSSHCHPFIRRMPISGKMKMFFGNKN